MAQAVRLVIYTDLDGTFLDHHTYTFDPLLPALVELKARRIPLVFCSSKTRAEIEPIRRATETRAPFVVENGGAIYVPEGYFSRPFPHHRKRDHYLVIELGRPYQDLVDVLKEIRAKTGARVYGFHDMAPQEVARECNLTLAQARLAKLREYDEPFSISPATTGEAIDPQAEARVLAEIEARGLKCARGGRYYHLTGNNDKGRAVRLLNGLYAREFGKIKTIALGDSLNDLPMLAAADLPVLVKRGDGSYDREIIRALPRVMLAPEVGPRGWNAVILQVLGVGSL